MGHNCLLEDSAIELLRDQLYGLADISISLFRKQKPRNRAWSLLPQIQIADRLTDTEHEKWEERAAIIEFDAGLPRSEAEAIAFNDFARSKRNPQ